MSVYDFGPVADAARLCQQRGLDCRFVIAGDGDYRDDIAALFDGAANVDFPGWVDQQQSHELVSQSSLALVPYKNLTNYTLNTPNKVVSNLQAGLPSPPTQPAISRCFWIGRNAGFSSKQAKISTIRLQTLQIIPKSCRKCRKMPGQLMKNCSTSRRPIINW